MDDGSTDESGNKISMAYWNGKSNDGEIIRFACYVSNPDDGDISVHYISADNNDIWNTMSDLIAINAKGAMRLAVGEIDQAEISELLINERGGMVVRLNWGMKNSAETAENAIAVHCSRLKDSIESFSEISELAIFWNIPYLEDKGGKCAFERLDGSLVKSDV